MGFPFALTVGAVTFLLGVIWGGPLIEVLRRFGVGKLIRSELGERQQRKVARRRWVACSSSCLWSC